MSFEIRKLMTFIEEVRTEGGRGDGAPLRKVATAVVFRNPYAGARVVGGPDRDRGRAPSSAR